MESPSASHERPWHSKTAEEIFAELRTSAQGLTEDEAKRRMREYGQNKLPEAKQKSLLSIFFEQFRSPLIYVLIVADVIVFFLREFTDGFIILFVLLFNAVLGTIQEGRAQNTLAALKKFVETTAEVIRGERELTIPDAEVVPGDILVLSEGAKIPADARILEAHNLKLEEAALTGESEPVRKTEDALSPKPLPTAETRNMVFKGTTIAVGYGRAVAVATGTGTVIGKISTAIEAIDTEIPLTRNLEQLARVVVIIVAVLVASLFALGVLEGKPVKEMFVSAVAISVAAVPEGLPLVLTVILAAGVWRMARRRVLVKKLQAVEALGQAQEIAVDKTGTITKNELVIRHVVAGGTTFAIEGIGYEPAPKIENPPKELLLAGTIAHLCSGAHVAPSHDESSYRVVGDPTEGAMTVFGEKLGLRKEDLLHRYRIINDSPFDYQKKYRVALYEQEGTPFLAVTGAPEVILEHCDRVLRGGSDLPLDAAAKRSLEEQFLAFSNDGLRVIAFAYLERAPRDASADHLPPLTFGGFFAMHDALRQGIREQVARAKEAGVRIIMITGDHAVTAKAIAKEAGIFEEGDDIMTGADVDALSQEEFRRRLPRTSVFARVTPEHKMKIIQDYKARGEVIAMTGDGVNDAPPLVAADLGIAMGKIGTEVAKEASDLVLMDDNFGDIIQAIEEGRNMRQGIRRTISYLFSSNFGEIVLIAAALLLKLPLPLLAAQIIWMNLVTDTFFDISLAMEPKDSSLMRRGTRIPKKLFDKRILVRLLILGPIIGLGALSVFEDYARFDIAKARTIALTSLVVFQWFNAWNCRSESQSILSIKPFSNRFLLFTFIWVITLHLIALYTPFMNRVLGLTPIHLGDWLEVIGVAVAVVVADELRKLFLRKKLAHAAA